MSLQKVLSTTLTSTLMGAQRLNIPLPASVKRPLNSFLTTRVRKDRQFQSIEDWSTPLVSRSLQAPRASESPSTRQKTTTGGLVSADQGLSSTALSIPAASAEPDALSCLLVTDSLDVGGMEEVVAFLAINLRRYGIRTTVLHASRDGTPDGAPSGRLGRILREKGIETMELDPARGHAWIESVQPDVISAHYAPFWVLESADRLAIPYVDTLHGMHMHYGADWAKEADRARRIAAIVCVGELLRQQYLNSNPTFAPDRIVTIPNGINPGRLVRHDRDRARLELGLDDQFLFLCLARQCMQKNAYGLIAAFDDVSRRHPDAHLLIAGKVDDVGYFAQVQRLRAGLECRNRVHIRDNYPDPAVLLAAADGFVLNSFFEGWSLASMEALCTGLPVVLSEVSGAREQLGDGNVNGWMTSNPAGDPLRVNWESMRETRFARQSNRDELVSAMCRIVDDRSEWLENRERLGNESVARFDPELCLQRHCQLLRAVAGREATISIQTH